ncbi:hypothetical protein HJG60_010488 [Phyllostomus discolor]|uniref:Uncharacterized protein n=1 Tax=Phyllostomus discolor TaxID=89673 RepID=A0A834ARD0_9CHIR|nr:hypothetical protein HJG60_010488 [Phyllostomus discolor]
MCSKTNPERSALQNGAIKLCFCNFSWHSGFQADEAEAAVAVDEDLTRLTVMLEELLEVLLCDIGRQVAHEEAVVLRVRLLARLEEALDIDGEAHCLLRAPLHRSRSGWCGLPSQHKRHGSRWLTRRC